METSEYGNTDLNSIISGDKDFALRTVIPLQRWDLTERVQCGKWELVDVDEEPEEDEDDSDFFDDAEENTLTKNK